MICSLKLGSRHPTRGSGDFIANRYFIEDSTAFVNLSEQVNQISLLKDQAIVIGLLSPYTQAASFPFYEAKKITSFLLELLPRTTRAQSMDVLSSQANLAGYRAVLEAADAYGRSFPMMMTAAGTIAPARLMVMGAGVAGLQAIATARRLGAIASATDAGSRLKNKWKV